MATANINLPSSDRSLSLFENANKALTQRLFPQSTSSINPNWETNNSNSKLQKFTPQVESSDQWKGQSLKDVLEIVNRNDKFATDLDAKNNISPLQIKADTNIPIGTKGFVNFRGIHDGFDIPIEVSGHVENNSNTLQKIAIPGAEEFGLIGKDVELRLKDFSNSQIDSSTIYA